MTRCIRTLGGWLLTHDETCHVWHQAAQVLDGRLTNVLEHLLDAYVRAPGLDQPMRLHASHISPASFSALCSALQKRRLNVRAVERGRYVELRSGLSDYLAERLLQSLVSASQGSESMDEQQLAIDLNL